jgi:hypothetical protein
MIAADFISFSELMNPNGITGQARAFRKKEMKTKIH